jgi:hypothetical protein
VTQLPLFESPGDDPARQPHAESARLLARLDNAKRYFRAQQDQIVALQAELETLKAALAHMQGEMETLKSANAQLEADLEQSRALHSAAYAQSHSLWQERNALRAAVETLRLANLRLEFEINLHRLHTMDTSPTPPPGEAGQGPDTLWRKLLTLCHPGKWDQGQPATALAHELTVEINRLRQSGRDL